MRKYYTRACNFYYGRAARNLIQSKRAFSLNGKKDIAFDKIEIFIREKGRVKSSLIYCKDIKKLKKNIKKIVKRDIKKITSKRKNFLKNVNFSEPSIMGVLNLTPDSFSDGGQFNKKNKSFKHISNMIHSGAEIVDVGGESTRPGSKTINTETEWKRVSNVIKKFKKKYKKICLSIDTRKSELMVKSIKCGADLINDVSGFNYDKNSLSKIKKYNIAKVLHHMKGTPNTMQKNPTYKNVLLDIYDFFEKEINKHQKKYSSKIILDPGIGFGKNLKHNLMLINKISIFHSLGFPILIGTSRKRFIENIVSNFDTKERLGGTLSSVLFLYSQGIKFFRVHNVEEVKQGLLVFESLLNK